jgi:hypothetical protein
VHSYPCRFKNGRAEGFLIGGKSGLSPNKQILIDLSYFFFIQINQERYLEMKNGGIFPVRDYGLTFFDQENKINKDFVKNLMTIGLGRYRLAKQWRHLQ